MKTFIFAIIASVALSGCAADLVDQRAPYDKAASQEITTPDGTFVVKDSPAEGKALIRPTLATAFSGGNILIPHFRGAVESMLKKSGRACRITEGYPNGDFYEFRYICK